MRIRKTTIIILSLLFCMSSFAEDVIDKESCSIQKKRVIAEWKDAMAASLSHNIEDNRICIGKDTMLIDVRQFGDEPEGGRSLWISLHGGGGTTKKVNDGQWKNQTRLYRPDNCYYVCPRAPWDAWNMWFQAPIDGLFDELIRTMTVCCGINPDKVYVMGYSAGGDGVWRLAPRLADHWAAAAMMAGHPGGVSLENVRNLPFTIWVGGEDDAYGRNHEVAARGALLDSLERHDRGAYIHQTHVLEGFGHWMERNDTAAVRWMSSYIRNPHPKKIVWRQEDIVRKYFYWLEVPESELGAGKTVIAEIKGNTVEISRCDYSTLTIYLDEDMVDLDSTVRVILKRGEEGKEQVFNPERKVETLRKTIENRGDPSYMFPVSISIRIEQE